MKLAADANASATLFGPDLGAPMLILNSDMPDMPLGGTPHPRGPIAGLPAAAEWVLVNNHFGSSEQAAWNKVGVMLTGSGIGGGEATTTLLSKQASATTPRSQLLFGPAW